MTALERSWAIRASLVTAATSMRWRKAEMMGAESAAAAAASVDEKDELAEEDDEAEDEEEEGTERDEEAEDEEAEEGLLKRIAAASAAPFCWPSLLPSFRLSFAWRRLYHIFLETSIRAHPLCVIQAKEAGLMLPASLATMVVTAVCTDSCFSCCLSSRSAAAA